MSSMNTRAPTDLHTRMNSLISSSSPYDDNDVPDDEQPTPHMNNFNRTSRPSSTSLAQEIPHDEIDALNDANDNDDNISSISKKKKVKDRPWQRANEYKSIATTCEEDMDIIGVSNVVSPNYKKSAATTSKRGDGVDHVNNEDGFQEILQEDIVDSYSFDNGVSSRWNNHQSSPEDAKAATVNAVGIAASQLADKLDQFQDDNDDEDDDEDVSYEDLHPELRSRNTTTSSFNNNSINRSNYNRISSMDKENVLTTPRKAADHNRVRMEALNLLNLADSKGNGGYLVRGESLKNVHSNTTTTTTAAAAATLKNSTNDIRELKKSRVQSALQGLSDGLGLDNKRKKYEKFTPDTMHFDDKDDTISGGNGLQDLSMEDMEYGKYPSSNATKSGNTWGSRYSVDRHLMALHGGLSSRQVLKNMEQGQYEDLQKQQQQNSMKMSATNMFKTSPHENGDHWNVAGGVKATPERQSRIWNTWIAVVREAVDSVVTKVSSAMKNDEHTTLGSHRQADHTSSASSKGIFTGVAVTTFLHKLSPTSRSTAMRSFTDPDDINFSAEDDYVYDQRLKRKKRFTMLVAGILLSIVIIGVAAGVSNRDRSAGIAPSMYSDVGEDVQFFVTSDAPHNTADEIKLTRELANLHPRDGDFLIHLGDVGDASVSMCTMSVYEDAADLLRQSPIPVFVIPGDNDWNNCPDPRSAFGYWMDELNRFEDNFDKEENTNFPTVRRQMARTENFSFLHKGVLFMAFHLVDGKVQSETEWSLRIAEDVAWMDEELNAHGVEEYRAVVILAHSAPTPKVGDFVWPLKNHLMKLKKPVLYLHANDGDGMLEYNPFPEDLPRLSVVRLEKGYKVSPTQIFVKTGPKPFKIQMKKD